VVSATPKAKEPHKLPKSALSAVCAIVCGLVLLSVRFGEPWRNASYDWIFRMSSFGVTNPSSLVLIRMDDEFFQSIGQTRESLSDRTAHVRLLHRLATDGCPLVVFDVFLRDPGDAATDLALAAAMRRLPRVVLVADKTNQYIPPKPGRPGANKSEPITPLDLFLKAAGETNFGVGKVEPDRDGIVRQHWRFPSPGNYDSLAWVAAQRAGAGLSADPRERWIRYYQPGWAWTNISYLDAEKQPTNFFSDKIVFIGNQPADPYPNEKDEFSTPYTGQTYAVGGVEILATEFQNLKNHEWLRRAPAWLEWLVMVVAGMLLGMLGKMRRLPSILLAVGAVLLTLISAACLSYFSDFWFPWLIVAGGQVPLALVFALVRLEPAAATRVSTIMIPVMGNPAHSVPALEAPVEVPDYELIEPPFGKGAYGQVWLARNAVGQWQAIKMIFRAKFGDDVSPYEREFRGIERYKRVADKHPGLLRIDFVSRMKPQGYFYYAMELGDAAAAGWEMNPSSYKPLDLAAKCAADGGRLPARDCLRICAKLCEPLQFLHEQGLAHRDVKPRNIIFVNGQPKLADVGLVTDAHRPVHDLSLVGTPGFMPPEPELPGTPQADIYGLGMMLYVIATGNKPTAFPEISATLVDRNRHPDFNRLSPIIFRACHHDRMLRYGSVLEMHAALMELEAALARESARPES
jgi:CHASE2 domain-containing sensor protein